MTASTQKSSAITNLGAPESLISDQLNGREIVTVDSIALATTNLDDSGDVSLLLPLPSSAVLTSLRIYNDDLDGGSALTLNVGVANGPDKFVDGSTAYAAYGSISATLFASAMADQSAITTGTELVIANASSHVDEMVQPLWQRAGLASDPCKLFCIRVAVQTAAGTPAAGRMVLVARHTRAA